MPETSNPNISSSLIGIGKIARASVPMGRKLIDLYKKEKHFVDTVAKSTAGAGAVSSVTNTLQKNKNKK